MIDKFQQESFAAISIAGDPRSIRYRYCIFSGGKFIRWDSVTIRSLEYCKYVNGLCCVEDKLGVEQSEYSRLTRNPLAMKFDEFQQAHERANQTLTEKDKVLVVEYFLPVTLTKSDGDGWRAEWSEVAKVPFHINANPTIFILALCASMTAPFL